jgi:hypothetical protein
MENWIFPIKFKISRCGSCCVRISRGGGLYLVLGDFVSFF